MPTLSIQERETCLETTWKKIEDTNIEIGKHELGSHDEVSLRHLIYAYIGLAQALEGSIAGKKKPAICSESALIEKKWRDARMVLLRTENRYDASGDGSFTLWWDRRELASKEWWSALDAFCEHHSKCQDCRANRSK